MSTVSSAGGRTDQSDEVRRLRDEYKKKEVELQKKQNKEIANLTKRHEVEMSQLEKQHSGDLTDAREKSHEALTQRDAKYQKEMDDLRKMQARQFEKLSQENQTKIESQRTSAESQMKDTQMAKSERERDLLKKYNQQLEGTQTKFDEAVQNMRDNQSDQIRQQRAQLTAKHEEEMNALREEQTAKVAALQRENRELNSSTTERLRDQDVRHMSSMQRMQNAHMTEAKKEEMASNKVIEESRLGFEEGLTEERNRFADAHERESNTNNEIRDRFQASVKDRIDHQVNRLENDIQQLKDKHDLERSQAKAEADREIRQMREGYHGMYERLEKARADVLNESNDRIAQKMKSVHDDSDKQMAANSRYYLDQNQIDNIKNRTAREQMEQYFNARTNYQNQRAETRIDKIRSEGQAVQDELRSNFDNNIEMQKSGFEDKKREIISNLEKDKTKTVGRIQDQAIKQEVDSQQNLNSVVSKYEKRLSDVNEQLVRERRMHDIHERNGMKELTRQHENEFEMMKMKYEQQAKETQVAHERELRQVERRNQEKLDQVLTSIKKQS
jgi:hypothetical protein